MTAWAAFALSLAGCATHAPAGTAVPLAHSRSNPDRTPLRQLRADLATIFNAPVMARGAWGIDIRVAETGDQIFTHNADRLMMPASNMKILTLAATAQTLGWDHRFPTTLETTGRIDAGVLRGDLIVRGSGDPSINSRANRAASLFDEWARALNAGGVRAIEGRILGDDQMFDDEGIGPGWSWDYLEAGYASPTGALQYNENVAELVVIAGADAGDPAVVRLAPGSGYTLANHALTVSAGSERARLNVHRRIDRPELEVSGTIAVGAKPLTRTVAVLNPTLFMVHAVKDALVTRGIAVSGDAMDADDVSAELVSAAAVERRALVTTQSPPLREIAAVLMKVSQNQYAETFLKAVGAKIAGIGTTDAGRAAAIATFTSWNIPRDGYVMSDGSGLSRYNYIAPSTVITVLRRMYGDPVHRDAFLATLPIAAKDGTISTRMRKTRAAENARAKTGSIANVRSLSGFVTTRDGETLVFSIMANDFVIPSATVDWVADLAVETLANFTRR